MLLKLVSSANKQGKRRLREMSFLRRLILQGRALLSEYQLFGYQRCYNGGGQPDWRFLKIELPPRGRSYGHGGGGTNPLSIKNAPSPSLSLPELSHSSVVGRVAGNATRPTSPASSAIQWVGQEFRYTIIWKRYDSCTIDTLCNSFIFGSLHTGNSSSTIF